MDSDHGIALKGICASYFENHVSPVLRYIQQAQEQLNLQMREIRNAVEQKANKAEVPTLRQFQDLVAKGAHDTSAVTTQVRLKEISSALQRKADVNSVATLANLNKLAATVEQKANAKDTITATQAAELLAAVERKADVGSADALAQLQELSAAMEKKANAADVATLEQLGALQLELLGLRAERQRAGHCAEGAEVRRVQVVVAAAGARFERQLRELRQQLRELREERLTGAGACARWPGRELQGVREEDTASLARSDAGSVVESEAASLTGSLAGSLAGSCCGSMAAEERAELQRVRAVVGAAGTAFARELRDLRGQLRALQAEVHTLRGEGGGLAGPTSKPLPLGTPSGSGHSRE